MMGISGSINYAQEIHVAKIRTDPAYYTSIQSAIDVITDNATGKRYAIIVHPGTYTEQVAMEDYVDLIAAGGREETIIYHECTGHDEPTVTGENSIIKGFTIQSYGGIASAFRTRCVNASTAGFEMEDCILTATNSAGVTDITLNATASCDIRDCVIDSGGVAVTGALFTTIAQTYNVERTTFDGATDAIQVTTAITALNLTNCMVSDHFNQDAGTVNIARCQLEAITLGTAACTLTAELSRFTAAFTTADNFIHTITCHKCTFNGQNFNNAAIGATAINLRGCDGIATLTNAGVGGTLNLYDCGVETLTTTQGTIVAYGGRINACGGSTGTSFVWWQTSDELVVMPNMLIANALTAAAAGGIVILIRPGTYAESNLTLVATVNLVGTDPDQCIISAASAGNAILNAGVNCSISNLTVTNTDAGAPAIAVTTNTLTVRSCVINGTGVGDAITMVAGTLNAYDTSIGAGDINLSTAICTLSMYRCRITTDPVDTAGAFAHVLNFEQCDFGNQNLTSAATGATTLDMTGCSHVGQISNAGTGAFTIRDSDVGDVTTTSTGDITAYGGDVGTCAAASAGGSIVWWLDSDTIKVIAGMRIDHALTAAAAGGIVIRLGQGTFGISNLTAVDDVDIVGEGAGVSLIQATDAGNPIIAVGNNITCRLFSVSVVNLGANNAINIAPVANNSSVIVRDCYIASGANGVSLTTTGAGAPSFEAFNTEFNVTTTAIAVSGAVVGDVDIHQGEFTCANLITFTGANHTFDAWDCACGGGAVTVTANVPPINMTRCNNIGAITNLTNALTLEHCTTGAITNTTGTVIIRNCNTGALNSTGAATVTITASNLGNVTQGAAAGTISLYNCSMGDLSTGAAGTIALYGTCYFTNITANAGVLTWKIDPNHIKVVAGTANMKIADALNIAAAGDVITIFPGTYAVANLTMKASVNLVGTDSHQCSISADSTANPVINCAVTCALVNLSVGATNAANPAIKITAGTLNVRNCFIQGTGAGDAIQMTAGIMNIFDTNIGVGDIDLSTAICTLSMYRCRITTDPVDTAGAFAHVLTFQICDFGSQNVTSAATGATTVTMRGCSGVGTVSNAGTGAFTISESGVATVTASSTGTIAITGGYVNACGGATASVTWRTGPIRYEVIPGMRIQDALTAGAGGEVIIHAGTYAPTTNLTVSANTIVRGEGKATVINSTGAAITNAMVLNGANIHVKDLKLTLAAGAGAGGTRPNVIYATAVTLLWLENLWLIGDTSPADDGSDNRQCGVCFITVTDSMIVDCRIEDNDRHGIILDTTSTGNSIIDNTLQGNTRNGVIVLSSNNNVVSSNTSYGNGYAGIKIDTAAYCTVAGNWCNTNTYNGIWLRTATNCTVTGNTCNGNSQEGIIAALNSLDNVITGNNCSDNDSGGTTRSGIRIDGSNRNTVTGNHCDGNGLHGIYIYRSSYCVVTGNSCHSSFTGDGINVTGDVTTDSHYNTLTGNVCTANADDGIEIIGGADAVKNIVVGNQLLGNGTALADAGNNTEIGLNISL